MVSTEVSVFVRKAQGGPVEVFFRRHEWQVNGVIAEVRFTVAGNVGVQTSTLRGIRHL